MMCRVETLIKLCSILLIVHSVLCEWKPNNKVKETLCNTPECKARGEDYKKNLNTKVNPCQDFYAFSCGSWPKNHPGPKYISSWTISDVIEFEFFGLLRKILESYNYQQGDILIYRQAKQIYEHCLKIPEYPMKKASDIAREITKIGRVPKTPLWNIHSKYLRLSGESALFQTKVMWSVVSKELPLLMFMEPNSAFGSIYHEEVWKPQEKQAYTDFLFRIMKSLNLKGSDTSIKERVEKVFQFRLKLDRVIAQNKKRHPDRFALYTGQELDTWLSQTLRQMTNTQKLHWTELIEALLQHVPVDQRRTRTIIAIRQKQYFLDLMHLLKTTSEEVLASHMEIYFVESHLKLDENMYKLLEKTSVEPHNFHSYIRHKYYPRWHKCIQDLNMKNTFEKLLYEKWFSRNYVDIIRTMNSKIKSAIEDQMKKSSWLDKPTRDETMRRIRNANEWFGFPPWIDGSGQPTIVRNQEDILIAQASFNYDLNLLYVQPPFLTPPMFSQTIPTVYNYAGLGATLGHEWYHVIDDCGVVELQSGRDVWWQLATRNECLKRKALFINAYNKITDREFHNRYNIALKSDTSASFLEDLPDVMGLEAAFNAYKELALKDKSVCQTLPNFEKFNCDQMFYIAFANTFCGYYTKKSAESRIIEKSTHSLNSVRVNGAVAQMKNFGTAFGCPVGSPMNPHQKLDMWK